MGVRVVGSLEELGVQGILRRESGYGNNVIQAYREEHAPTPSSLELFELLSKGVSGSTHNSTSSSSPSTSPSNHDDIATLSYDTSSGSVRKKMRRRRRRKSRRRQRRGGGRRVSETDSYSHPRRRRHSRPSLSYDTRSDTSWSPPTSRSKRKTKTKAKAKTKTKTKKKGSKVVRRKVRRKVVKKKPSPSSPPPPTKHTLSPLSPPTIRPPSPGPQRRSQPLAPLNTVSANVVTARLGRRASVMAIAGTPRTPRTPRTPSSLAPPTPPH